MPLPDYPEPIIGANSDGTLHVKCPACKKGKRKKTVSECNQWYHKHSLACGRLNQEKNLGKQYADAMFAERTLTPADEEVLKDLLNRG